MKCFPVAAAVLAIGWAFASPAQAEWIDILSLAQGQTAQPGIYTGPGGKTIELKQPLTQTTALREAKVAIQGKPPYGRYTGPGGVSFEYTRTQEPPAVGGGKDRDKAAPTT